MKITKLLLVGVVAALSAAAAPATLVTGIASQVDSSSTTVEGEAPADGEDDEWVPNLRQERVFFRCDPTRKNNNVGGTVLGPVPWSTTPPAGTIYDGEGCTAFDTGHTGNEPTVGVTFAGTYTANLDTLTITQYALSLGNGDNWSASLGLTIDGHEVLPFPTSIRPTAIASNGGVTTKFEISVTDIGLLEREDETLHEIELTWSYDTFDRLVLWAWDNHEVPSGITFNPKNLGADVISVAPADAS